MSCAAGKITGVYRPRQPLESDFHRLVREQFNDFQAVYDRCYARKFGFWRPVIARTVNEFLRCGDLREGFARVRCPDCRHEFFVAFSCKQRCICPSCHQKRALLLGIHIAEDVCEPVAHRQFVWTIPKRLRVFFRFHRHLLHRLPNLAWKTIREVYRAVLERDDLVPGGIITIQTFGQLIHFHPHLHGLVTDGAFTTDGQFIRLPRLDDELFLQLWEQRVFQLLLDEGKIEPKLVDQMRGWRHSGFSVNRNVRLEGADQAAIQRLAQYMARCPFSLARLIRITDTGKVLYRGEKTHCHRFPEAASEDLFGGVSRNFQVFEPLDFLAELTQHIPNKSEHLIRYYGWYSNKTRGTRARAVASAGEAVAAAPPAALPSPTAAGARRRWAALIKRVYQTDPLRCPRCGGKMRIISFIEAHQEQVIERILRHCGLWSEPPPRAPPRPALVLVPSNRVAEPGLDLDPEFLEHQRWEQIELAFEA